MDVTHTAHESCVKVSGNSKNRKASYFGKDCAIYDTPLVQ